MSNHYRIAAVVMLAAALACGTGHAQSSDHDQPPPPTPGPHAGDEMNFCGKVVELVASGCLGIVSLHTTYELTDVKPKPAVGTTISGTGIVGNEPSVCMQGIHFHSASWKAVQACGTE